MPKYSDPWVDEKLEVTEELLAGWSPERAAEAEIARMINDIKMLTWAAQIPRRLGGLATGAELALDKKLLKSAIHMLRGLVANWYRLTAPGGSQFSGIVEVDDIPDELKKLGAQLDVKEWAARDKAGTEAAVRRNVTIAVAAGLRPWANKAALLYVREIESMMKLLAM